MKPRQPQRPLGPQRCPPPPEVICGVSIDASCEFCGTCLAICPDVFVFTPHGIQVVDTDFQEQSEAIVAAAKACPLVAIRLT